MTPIRDAYLIAAQSAVDLIGDPAVTEAWTKPSALAEFSVSGLAGHLAAQVLFVPHTISQSALDLEAIPLLGHYDRVTWIGADPHAEISVKVRDNGELTAEGGAEALTERLDAAIAELRTILAAEPADRVVEPPAGPWGLLLDDFLITRMMEIAVHSDDLAYSVGTDTPHLPVSVLHPVFDLLFTLSLRRHGEVAMLRALSRAERAPAAINAI